MTTREVVHYAIRAADQRGCCNLPACAFARGREADRTETMLCDELVAAFDAEHSRRTELAREVLRDVAAMRCDVEHAGHGRCDQVKGLKGRCLSCRARAALEEK